MIFNHPPLDDKRSLFYYCAHLLHICITRRSSNMNASAVICISKCLTSHPAAAQALQSSMCCPKFLSFVHLCKTKDAVGNVGLLKQCWDPVLCTKCTCLCCVPPAKECSSSAFCWVPLKPFWAPASCSNFTSSILTVSLKKR